MVFNVVPRASDYTRNASIEVASFNKASQFFLFFFLDQSNGRFEMFQMGRCFSRLIAFTTSEVGRVKIRGIGFVRSSVSRVEKGQQNAIPG